MALWIRLGKTSHEVVRFYNIRCEKPPSYWYIYEIFVETLVYHDNSPKYIIDGSYVLVSNFPYNDIAPNGIYKFLSYIY